MQTTVYHHLLLRNKAYIITSDPDAMNIPNIFTCHSVLTLATTFSLQPPYAFFFPYMTFITLLFYKLSVLLLVLIFMLVGKSVWIVLPGFIHVNGTYDSGLFTSSGPLIPPLFLPFAYHSALINLSFFLSVFLP